MFGFTRPRRGAQLPGLRLSLTYTLVVLAVFVFLPLFGLSWKASAEFPSGFLRTLSDPRVLAAFRLSFTAAIVAALVSTFFGLIIAWVLERYTFVGRRLLDALVDLPFALPTAVAGIALTAIYAENGFLGAPLAGFGIRVAFTPLGVMVALVFVGMPFVVRTVQPIVRDLDADMEEAALTLGASRRQVFTRVILPELTPALLTGFTLALARGLGEYGSVVFISGNMPMSTEILPLLIITKLEQYDYVGATVIAAIMLIASLFLLLTINGLERWQRTRAGVA